MKMNKTLTALVASATLGLTGQAFAVGTEAGSRISNTVDLSYSVNSVPQDAVTATTNFIVDNRIDVTVVSNTPTETIVPGQLQVPFQFTITNEGNFAQSYELAVTNATTADVLTDTEDTSSLTVTFYTTADKSTPVPLVGGKPVLNLAKDAAATPVWAFIDFPTTTNLAAPNDKLVNNDVVGLLMSTKAVYADGSTITPDITTNKNASANLNIETLEVFAEDASGSSVAYDGTFTVTSAVTISTAKFEDPNNPGASPALSVKVINDPICNNGLLVAGDNVDHSDGSGNNCHTSAPTNYTPKAIPGSQVQFTYEAENNGAINAGSVVFSEVLPAEYLDNSLGNATLSHNGGANETLTVVTDAPDAANEVRYDSTTGTITLFVGPVLASEDIKITFTAIVE